jgi:hypothetical protein
MLASRMSVRKLLPIVLLLAAVSIRCSGSPSEPDGVVLITQTTSTTTSTSTTTTVIPALTGGSVGASPSSGLAAATVFSFFVAAPPTGGVPPYVFTWTFGDGGEGAGNAPSHLYPIPGVFAVTATATDSRGMTTQASTVVAVRTVSGRWIATFPPASGLMPQPIDLVQAATAVTAAINDSANSLGFASGMGAVTNPRNLSISATFRAGTPIAFGVTYIGRLDDTLSTWSGLVTGYAGCPCEFTATRVAFAGDSIGLSSLPVGR